MSHGGCRKGHTMNLDRVHEEHQQRLGGIQALPAVVNINSNSHGHTGIMCMGLGLGLAVLLGMPVSRPSSHCPMQAQKEVIEVLLLPLLLHLCRSHVAPVPDL